MQVNPSVFKAYDIRGVVGKTIDEAFAEHLGRIYEKLGVENRTAAAAAARRHAA